MRSYAQWTAHTKTGLLGETAYPPAMEREFAIEASGSMLLMVELHVIMLLNLSNAMINRALWIVRNLSGPIGRSVHPSVLGSRPELVSSSRQPSMVGVPVVKLQN